MDWKQAYWGPGCSLCSLLPGGGSPHPRQDSSLTWQDWSTWDSDRVGLGGHSSGISSKEHMQEMKLQEPLCYLSGPVPFCGLACCLHKT